MLLLTAGLEAEQANLRRHAVGDAVDLTTEIGSYVQALAQVNAEPAHIMAVHAYCKAESHCPQESSPSARTEEPLPSG